MNLFETAMKHLYLIPALCVMAAGCSDSNDEKLPELSEKTYSGLTELGINYDGAPMVGKTLTVTPSGSEASFTFDSEVDLSALSDALKVLPPVAGPGVMPGSPVLTIPVSLKPDGGQYSFSGTGSTDFATYVYSGTLTDGKVQMDFSNVKLKDTRLAGKVWKPAPINSSATDYSSPLHIVWETSQPGLLENFDGSIQDALRLVANLPFIPAYGGTAYMSPAQVIANGLKTICFNADGNLVVTYLQSANGAAQFAQAPLCMIQYLPLTESMMKLFINPTDLMSVIVMNNTNKPDIPEHPFGSPGHRLSRADNNASLPADKVIAIMQKVAPMLSEGFPMAYTETADKFDLFIPSEVLLPLVKDVVAPLLADPVVQAMIIEKLEGSASLQPYLPIVKGMLVALPLILETTTRAEIGFSFVK